MIRALLRHTWARLLCRVGYHDWTFAFDVRTGEFNGWYCAQCLRGRDVAEVAQ